MARKVQQIRYYGDHKSDSDKNQPANLTGNRLRSGSILNQYTPIKQIGVQTMPSVKLYLNNSIEPIIIGSTGIYELDLEGISKINNLKFAGQSLSIISNNSGAGLIVDAVCEGGAN